MGKQHGTSVMGMNVLEATKIQTFGPLLLLNWLEFVILLLKAIGLLLVWNKIHYQQIVFSVVCGGRGVGGMGW